MNSRIIKVRGEAYEIDHVVHSKQADGKDVYCCYRLSATDGMPTGPRVYITQADVDATHEGEKQ